MLVRAISLRLSLSLSLLVLAPSVWAAPTSVRITRAQKARTCRVAKPHSSFDWDDNILVMPTRMYIRHKHNGTELALSTAEWAHAKDELGKPGRLQQYELDPDKRVGGFREFADQGPVNYFLRDVRLAIESGPSARGPAWNAFVEQLSTKAGARKTTIITAREHSPETMYAGLRLLRSRGLIRYLPPKKNLYAVNRPAFSLDGGAVTGPTPERKLKVQQQILDRLVVAAASGRGVQRWHFSDDDWANFEATREGLAADLQRGRWPGVTVKLHFTGLGHPTERPHSLELNTYAAN